MSARNSQKEEKITKRSQKQQEFELKELSPKTAPVNSNNSNTLKIKKEYNQNRNKQPQNFSQDEDLQQNLKQALLQVSGHKDGQEIPNSNQNFAENDLGKFDSNNNNMEQNGKSKEKKLTFKDVLKIQKLIFKEAIPGVFCFEMQLLTLSLINYYYIGHQNDANLMVAFGIGDVLSKMFGHVIIKYLHMGLLSQCSQAFGYKQSQKAMIGVFYQRGLMVSGFICILCTLPYFFADKIVLMCGMNEDIAEKAARYVWVSLPSLYAFTYYDATKTFLQSQNIFIEPMYMQLLQVIFQFFLSGYLIDTKQMGLEGAAWSKNLSDAFVCILIYIYCTRSKKIRETWIEWNSNAFNRLSSYIKFTTLFGLAGYIQEFSFYILVIFATHFTTTYQTATQMALSNSQLWHFNFFLGFHVVMINYMATFLMAGKYNKTQKLFQQGLFITWTLSMIIIILVWYNQAIWANLFTDISEITEHLKDTIKIYLVVLFFDAIQLTLGGILKGIDKQKITTIVYLIAYVFIALPLSYYLAFNTDTPIKGLYIGWLVGAIISTISFILIFWKTNWKKQYLQIQRRMLKENFGIIKEQELLHKQGDIYLQY